MKKVLGGILFVLYAIIAITVTVLLLSYNDYNISELGGYTVYIVKDDSLEPKYKEGSILLIKSTSDKNVQVGDEMLLYKVINTSEFEVITANLVGKTQQGTHIMYVVGEDESYASDYLIGKTSDTTVIEGWGYVLNLLESKWGYLFCVVVVSLLLFLQEVFDLVMEIKYLNKKKKEEEMEAEYEVEDDEESEEPVKRTKKTSSTSSKTTKKTASSSKAKTTGTKTSTAKKPTTKKTTDAKKSTSTSSKTTGTKKTTRKVSDTKSAKEEE